MTQSNPLWTKLRTELNLPRLRTVRDVRAVSIMETYVSPYKEVLDAILEQFPQPVYIFGGPPRDVLRYVLEGVQLQPPDDLDVFIDDSDKRPTKQELEGKITSLSFGEVTIFDFERVVCIHLRTDLIYEIFPFSGKFIYLEYPQLPVTLETTLAAIDLNTSAGCYDLRNKQIISCGVLEGIERRVVETQYVHPLSIDDTLARLIIHSAKLGYRLGSKAVDFIQRNYTPDRRYNVLEQVRKKHPSHSGEEIVAQLDSIIRQRR